MIRNRFGALGAACVFLGMLAVACGGGSSSNGDKAAFCKTNAEISAGLSSATSADQLVSALKTVQNKFDGYVSSAPSDVKGDAQTLVDAAKKAISSNDASPFQTDTKLQAAGSKVDSFCGQSSSSSSSSSASGSAASSSSGGTKQLVACNVFDLKGLNDATGLTWKVVDQSRTEACVVQADNGNTISMVLAPTAGQTQAILTGGKSACDSGTAQEESIADGGFICQVSGINTGGAVYAADNTFVSVSAITFNGAADADIQKAIVALLKSFQA
ncbi:MAG: hypothetical protein QOG69_2308 [Actinomycetota bacterium]|nr:hypothetical protein [Actinomycetota bacterium]